MNSEGWRLKLAIFIHLLAPLISKSKNNIVTNKIIQKIIPNRDNLLMLFKSKKEMKIINAIPQKKQSEKLGLAKTLNIYNKNP